MGNIQLSIAPRPRLSAYSGQGEVFPRVSYSIAALILTCTIDQLGAEAGESSLLDTRRPTYRPGVIPHSREGYAIQGPNNDRGGAFRSWYQLGRWQSWKTDDCRGA